MRPEESGNYLGGGWVVTHPLLSLETLTIPGFSKLIGWWLGT